MSRLLSALLVAAVASNPGAGQQAWTGTIEERDGAIWAENGDEPLWPDDGSPRIRFQLERTYGAEEDPFDALLTMVLDFTVDEAGRVYVLDGRDNQIIAFDEDGTFLWRAGRPGRGPGEIDNPRGLVWKSPSSLILLNRSGSQLDLWSSDGDYLDTWLLAETGVGLGSALGVASSGNVVLLRSTAEEFALHELRLETPIAVEQTQVFDNRHDVRQPRSWITGDMRVSASRVHLGGVFSHRFRVMSLDGDDLVVTRKNPDFVPAVVDPSNGTVSSMASQGAPLRLADGRWLVRAAWPLGVGNPLRYHRTPRQDRPSLDWRTALELYDEEGRWLAADLRDGFADHGTLAWTDTSGRVYTTTWDPYPQVRRYSVSIREPGAR